jgi:integrase
MRRPNRAARGDAAPAPAADDPFEIGGYYLDRPHPTRGNAVYACRYDAAAGCVRRRTLKTTDWEEAKTRLAELVLSVPATAGAAVPGPDQVLTVAALANYVDGHATTIRSESDAIRAAELAQQYLEVYAKKPLAPVSFWTPSRQLDFARWLRLTFNHSPASIERRLDVVHAAFSEMTEVKLRTDPFGQQVETALMTHAPKFVYKRDRIARELKIPPSKARHNKLSLQDMATVLDTLDQEHLFRFAMIALNTWARPEAIADFDPVTQRRDGLIDLNPPDRVVTNKRRSVIPETRCLAGWLDKWGADEPLLMFQGERVRSVKKALGRQAARVGVAKFAPGRFRHFMTTWIRHYARNVTREQRSIWLGHVVKEGSRTTDNYEADDPEYLIDVALGTDHIMQLLQSHCRRKLFAIEVRLNRNELSRIGAQKWQKNSHLQVVVGGRREIRTPDPLGVNEML